MTKGTVLFGIILKIKIPSDTDMCWMDSFCSAKENRPLCHIALGKIFTIFAEYD